MTDIQGMLRLWRKHFDGLLKADTNSNEVEPEISNADYGIYIDPLDYDEVCIAFKRLKMTKLRGLMAS